MPTYEYRCLKCKKTFDVFQRMSDALLKHCHFCKGKVERLIGAGAGLIFKGSGFYITDYKKKPEAGSRKPEEQKSETKKPEPKKPEAKKQDA